MIRCNMIALDEECSRPWLAFYGRRYLYSPQIIRIEKAKDDIMTLRLKQAVKGNIKVGVGVVSHFRLLRSSCNRRGFFFTPHAENIRMV